MPTTATKATRSSTASFDAITAALRLVQSGRGVAASEEEISKPAALPSAAFRVAIDELAGQGTHAALDASRPNLKAMMGNVLNWSGQPRATKTVTKVVGATMSGTDDYGNSLYPQSLEMLSFLALCAPLLEPDRLARIAALASQTPNAYKPIRYLVRPSGQLQELLGQYSDQRREALLASLWVTAHDGRWWDATSGEPATARRRRREQDAMPQEQREAISAQIERALRGRQSPTPQTLADAFRERLLTYSGAATDIARGVRITSPDDRRALHEHVTHPDPDVPVLLSYVPGLLPDDRAESPIPQLIDMLAGTLTDRKLPEKPDDWPELYPSASRDGFPIPREVADLHRTELPGLPDSRVLIMRNPDALQRNAQHMGNCTFSYRARAESGTSFIGHLAYGNAEYNFAVAAAHPAGAEEHHWRLGEVNSRFNAGNVPAEVRAALTATVAALATAPW